MILSNCEPKNVFRFFEAICAIPHTSGHERKIADYVEAFARERGLYCYRDEADNVFVKCPATPGRENAPAVLLQGHLDMVGEKDGTSTHDFLTDGLKLTVEDGWIHADGTTLGGDDGAAVAIMLALLDHAPDPHPALECLFTTSEETGLCGAWAFDPDKAGLTAGTLINLDSEAEGIITAGCAGGVRTDVTLPITRVPLDGQTVTLSLTGFSGGHSGVEIIEGHTNAIKALGRLLSVLSGTFDVSLIDVSGGGKDNAIPRAAQAALALRGASVEAFREAAEAEADRIRTEPSTIPADRAFVCAVTPADAPAGMMDTASTARVIDAILLVRSGVIEMSAFVKNLVAFSRNLGILQTEGDRVVLSFSNRSASEHQLDAAQRELDTLARVCGGTAVHYARYPGWDYAPVSPLRTLWTRESERLFGITPKVEVIHAGLECGILCHKRPGMDIISVGPDIKDIHTPRERLSVDSTRRTWELVCAVLAVLA